MGRPPPRAQHRSTRTTTTLLSSPITKPCCHLCTSLYLPASPVPSSTPFNPHTTLDMTLQHARRKPSTSPILPHNPTRWHLDDSKPVHTVYPTTHNNKLLLSMYRKTPAYLPSHLHSLLEGLGLVKCCLTDGAVHCEDHQVRGHGISNLHSTAQQQQHGIRGTAAIAAVSISSIMAAQCVITAHTPFAAYHCLIS